MTEPVESTRIIPAKMCEHIAKLPYVRLVPGKLDPRELNVALADYCAIKPFDDIVVQIWPSVPSRLDLSLPAAMSVSAAPFRRVVVTVDGVGAHDGSEFLTPRERFRLNQFRDCALVGLTQRTAAAPYKLLRFLRRDEPLPLGAVVWYDLFDRERGTFVDYDEMVHKVNRLGRLATLNCVLRGPFRSWAGCDAKYKPIALGDGDVPSSYRFADGEERPTAALKVEDWIRGAILERFLLHDEFLLRSSDDGFGPDGERLMYLIRRSDWSCACGHLSNDHREDGTCQLCGCKWPDSTL